MCCHLPLMHLQLSSNRVQEPRRVLTAVVLRTAACSLPIMMQTTVCTCGCCCCACNCCLVHQNARCVYDHPAKACHNQFSGAAPCNRTSLHCN